MYTNSFSDLSNSGQQEAASQDKLSDVDPATAAKPSVPKYTVPDMSGDQAEVEPDSSPEASEESGESEPLSLRCHSYQEIQA